MFFTIPTQDVLLRGIRVVFCDWRCIDALEFRSVFSLERSPVNFVTYNTTKCSRIAHKRASKVFIMVAQIVQGASGQSWANMLQQIHLLGI